MERPHEHPARKTTLTALALFASLSVLAVASAEAQDPMYAADDGGPLDTPTGSVALQLGLGGAFGLTGNGYAQFKLAAEGVYHFDGATGPAVGAAIHVSFVDFVALQFLGRFQWDIEVVDGLLITPFANLGAVVLLSPFDTAGLDIGFGADAKFAFGQFYAWVRPISLELWIQSDVAVRWDVLAGGGVTF
jgi:hypothetical protein